MKRLTEFLENTNLSKTTARKKKGWLIMAFKFFRSINTSENFLEIQPSEFLQYYQWIDKKNITRSAKNRYIYALKSYVDYLLIDLYSRNEKTKWDYTYIFSKRFFKFRDIKDEDEDYFFLEYKDVIEFLKWAKYTLQPYLYYAICIQATTGCRISGLLTLTKDRIDFTKRLLIMHEKGKDRGSNISKYVLAENLIEPLKQFIAKIETKKQRIFNISPQKYNQHLKKWNIAMHSHCFRDALYSIWEDQKVEESIRDILQNRIPKGIGPKHYLKKFNNWDVRVNRYDEIYPFQEFIF